MIRTSFICFLILLLVFNFCHETEGKIHFMSKHTIRIYSSLPTNSPQLILHCFSKDDDFGNHTLSHGSVFGWHFRVNMFGTTKYRCDFWWGKKAKRIAVFYGVWDIDSYHHTYNYFVHTYGLIVKHDQETQESPFEEWDD
ncbi:hypothetical protein OROMI_033052 [Orobanche minor]